MNNIDACGIFNYRPKTQCAPRPGGKWLYGGLQNRGHRFNSGPGLQTFCLCRLHSLIAKLLFVGRLMRLPCQPGAWHTMMGFGAITREAGFDFWMTTLTTLSVWGMPGQVAFVSLYATGSSMFLMVVAVALANMRMMLMVISGADTAS